MTGRGLCRPRGEWCAAAVVTAALLVAPHAHAQTPVNTGASVPPGTSTHVKLQSGSVRLTGWERDSVHVSGLLAPGESWVIRLEGDTIRLRAEGLPRGLAAPSELEIFVPRSAGLVVRAAAASMVVREFDQDVDVATAAGNLLVELVRGGVRAETMQGTLTVVGTNPRVQASTASGALLVSVPYDTVGSEAAGRTVQLRAPAGPGGPPAFGEVTLRSVSGNIELNAPRVGSALVQNVRGDTRVVAEPVAGGRLLVRSHVGRITLGWRDDVAPAAGTRVDVGTMRGGLRGDVPARWVRVGGAGGGARDVTTLLSRGEAGVRWSTEPIADSLAVGAIELRNVRGDVAFERWVPPVLR